MRYWIWCNDLIQGPFEPDELASLRVFSEDLLVCLEGREDWAPAGRVADLSASLEQQKMARAQPLAPPPPPPSRPPSTVALQGEFFGDVPGQQSLLETEDAPKGPFAFRPVTADPEVPAVYFSGQATMPFHFNRQSNGAEVIALPRQAPQKIRFFPRREGVKESPVLKEELPEPVPLRILHEDTIAKPAVLQEVESPSLAPSLEEPAPSSRPEWLPWIMGVALAIACLGSMGHWLMDRVNTHSAIREANRLEPPVPMSLPATTPLPAPNVDIRDRTVPAAAVAPARAPAKRKSFVPVVRKKVRAAAVALKRAVIVETSAWPSRLRHAIFQAQALLKSVVPVSGGTLVAPTPTVQTRRPPAPAATVVSAPKPAPAVGAAKKKKSTPRRPTAHPAPRHRAPTPAPKVSPAAAPVPVPIPIPLPGLDAVLPVKTPAPRAADPWAGHQSDAIRLVMGRTLPGSKITVGVQARTMLKQMHEKELMHAAETGERLYLPDKMAWAALQEEGVRYRVYLNFQAMQANGERLQTRSYQFIVDLKSKAVRADDPATEQDLLTQNAELNFKHNPMATDIDSILGGVDAYNKQKVHLIIIRQNRSNRNERKQLETALKAAQDKVQRAIMYFRRTYADKALQNVARAYDFAALANGK